MFLNGLDRNMTSGSYQSGWNFRQRETLSQPTVEEAVGKVRFMAAAQIDRLRLCRHSSLVIERKA